MLHNWHLNPYAVIQVFIEEKKGKKMKRKEIESEVECQDQVIHYASLIQRVRVLNSEQVRRQALCKLNIIVSSSPIPTRDLGFALSSPRHEVQKSGWLGVRGAC
jgi:hypothetical protein